MSLFKKPKSRIKVRVTRNDSDEDESKSDSLKPVVDEPSDSLRKPQVLLDETVENSTDDSGPFHPVEPSSSSTKPPLSQPNVGEKKFDPKVKLKLSFGDDEEEEADVFKVKKSAYSRRIAKQLKREKKKKAKEEKLEEAKRNEKLSPSENLFSFERIIEEPKSPEISELPNSLKLPEIHFKEISSHEFNPSRTGHIPSAKEIYAARKKREEERKKMRMDNVIEDFISVEEETAAERAAAGHFDDEQPTYEEDGDNDDDDDDDRMDFAVDREALERVRNKEAFMQAQEEDAETQNRNRDEHSDDSESDEMDLWEKEQIRKGVGYSIPSIHRDQQPNSQLNDLMDKLDLPSTSDKPSRSSLPSYLLPLSNSNAIDEYIDKLTEEIYDKVKHLEQSIAQDEKELMMIREDKKRLMAEMDELQEKLEESGLDEEPAIPKPAYGGLFLQGKTLNTK